MTNLLLRPRIFGKSSNATLSLRKRIGALKAQLDRCQLGDPVGESMARVILDEIKSVQQQLVGPVVPVEPEQDGSKEWNPQYPTRPNRSRR